MHDGIDRSAVALGTGPPVASLGSGRSRMTSGALVDLVKMAATLGLPAARMTAIT